MNLVIGLFEQGEYGTRLLGRSRDPELVELVRENIAALIRADIEQIEDLAAISPVKDLQKLANLAASARAELRSIENPPATPGGG